ncbi:MAG TPA: sulfatase [Candidatus Latescibacteria bacterium]|nr:sulfatase [Gemmatimonadaceae bacterium]MDP6017888.1 sulfatase [Candidatus Latescibacterota bacterium]HJP30495.1 sulfatase [Candidatus Latescibacterota bacterium]
MSPPNILFLHAHNTGRFIEPYGHAVPTPHLMKLARAGSLFRRAFSAAPSCSPSRAAFLTGQYPHCSGMLGLAHRGFALSHPERHIARILGGQGYETAQCGTEHVHAHEKGTGSGGVYDHTLTRDDSARAMDVAPAVCDYLRSAPSEPFFLNVGTQQTHTPYPEPQPDLFAAENPDHCSPPRPFADTPALRRMTAGLKRSAREMDAAFGAIIDTLAETGQLANTYIFAFTDHGLQWPLHIGNVGEHGNAAFLLAHGPEHFGGRGAIDAMVSLMDLLPTVCDLAGIARMPWLQGESLLPLVDGEVDHLRRQLFFEQTYHAAYEPMRAVRTGRHIYIRRFDDRQQLVLPNTDDTPAKQDMLDHEWQQQPRLHEMLYDHYFDPDQQSNLIDRPDLTSVRQQLGAALDRWMADTDDPLLRGPVALPGGVQATDPDAFSPGQEPLLTG